MAKMDYSRTSRPDFGVLDHRARCSGWIGAYEAMYNKNKKKKKKYDPLNLDAALRWVLFDTFEYKRLGYYKEGPNKLYEIRRFVIKYRGENNLNEHQTLRKFKDYLLEKNILDNFDESKGKLTTLIIAILYSKYVK